MIRTTIIALAALTLAGCNTRKDEIGVPPALSPVGYGVTTAEKGVRYPGHPTQPVTKFSLWNDGQSRLFTDARAHRAGDILTVAIRINDRARFRNESERSRTSNRGLGFAAGFAFGGAGGSAEADGEISSVTDSKGRGATARSEDIQLSIAAVVTGVLPNGNLIIQGSQEVLVNAELRVLTIDGIVRQADISGWNTVPYERIAEARISYGGRGRLTEVQQPPYGQQILDTYLPF